MKHLPKILYSLVIAVGIICISMPAFASSLPVGVSQFFLAGAGTTSSASTIQLTSFTTPDGRPVTMSMFGTIGYAAIDPQTTSKIEDITFTGIVQNGNGTASLTGVTRGLDFVFPYASTGSLMKSHSGGATVIITNTAGFYYNEFTMNNNSNLFTWPVASSSPASKGYVDFVAFNGAAVLNASEILKGVVQLATGLQAASSTSSGSTGGRLVLPASIATTTFNSATAANVVPVTGITGKIDANFIPGLATTTLIGAFPAYQVALQRQIFSTPGTTTFSTPSGITKVNVQLVGAGGAGGGAGACGGQGNSGQGGGAGGYADKIVDLTGTTSVQVFVGSGGTGVSNTTGNTGTWSTFGTNGFYEYATPGQGGVRGSGITNTPQGSGGVGVNGDLNISGQDGIGGFTNTLNTTIAENGGVGGSSVFGGGGITNSGNYGGGGGGAFCVNNAASLTGGSGGPGVVIVSW